MPRRFPGFKARSLRRLAHEAAKFADGWGDVAAIEDRLRKAFSQQKKLLLETASYADDVEETIELGALAQIRDLLAPFEIRLKISDRWSAASDTGKPVDAVAVAVPYPAPIAHANLPRKTPTKKKSKER
jgi:hypothetical protein